MNTTRRIDAGVRRGLVLLLAGFVLAGCAPAGTAPINLARTGVPDGEYCANGNKPACTQYLGRKQQCSCMSRAEFEQLIGR